MVQHIQVEVVYAGAQAQSMISLRTVKGSTVGEIIQQSGVLAQHPEIHLDHYQTGNRVGIWGKLVELSREVTQEGSRIEIYRPLLIDPKQARLKRVYPPS